MLNYKERNKVKKVFKHAVPIVFVILLMNAKVFAVAQNLIIHNDSIQFKLVLTTYNPVEDTVYTPMKYHILIENQPKQIILDHYAQMDTSKIFSLLANPECDWATTIILYNLYDINALFFSAFDIMTREDWLGYFQKRDIAMWKEFFQFKQTTEKRYWKYFQFEEP